MDSQPGEADRLPAVNASWERCLSVHHLEPDRVPDPDVLTHAEFGFACAPTEELAAISRGEIDRLFQQLSDHVHLLMLADATGTLMVMRCDPSLDAACAAARILPGSIWREESQGTNGIGLCLQERAPVSVVMDDHFATRLSSISCTVAPIFGRGGQLQAVLNVSSLKPSSRTVHAIAREVVQNSARRIENRVFDIRCAGHIVLRLSPHDDFCDPAGEARVALDDHARVVDATPAACRILGIHDSLIGHRLPGVDDPEELGRLLRSPVPSIRTRMGRVGIRLADTSVQFGRHDDRSKRHATPVPVLRKGSASAGRLCVEDFAGSDPLAINRLHKARRLFDRGVPLLLQGESGSGKTMLARALHEAGPNAAGPFVAINCAALPAELIESELFGYRPGAFTGASRSGSRGRILEADGGTLFLDEIGDMPLDLQSRFLQVLSDREFVPIGATQPVRVNFSLVSASLRDIHAMVQDKRFRDDLFYRIQGASLALPPLRERDDLEELIQRVFKRVAEEIGAQVPRLSPVAQDALANYRWPGNIRELQHVARYVLAIHEGACVELEDLPPQLHQREGIAETRDRTDDIGLPKVRTRNASTIRDALVQMEWNVTLAARYLGMSRATLHRRLRDLKISRSDTR
ncbi:sigma-54-dependent Fis family transcriptional regulator [Hydrogenophaga sp. YM1]|uniref:sigma-54-dependent Fis family transcriptional regulator n=1 Tax=Hydrogenophaga sp. YM1 TaxID=2806262 RepID=UPI00195E06DB|nr:sigma-54-dependent Fis family transcriptional regulator [Hydrogenophaga sp. YM1]QRR32468.1 sigma-54-dependent Fis family transcriptional regulator [Hydrogenophaga sp. YM1]